MGGGSRADTEGVPPTLPGLPGPGGSGVSVGQRWGRVARVHGAGALMRRGVGELAMARCLTRVGLAGAVSSLEWSGSPSGSPDP